MLPRTSSTSTASAFLDLSRHDTLKTVIRLLVSSGSACSGADGLATSSGRSEEATMREVGLMWHDNETETDLLGFDQLVGQRDLSDALDWP